MKSMLMPFVIFALVSAVVLFGFFVFNTTYGKGFEKNIGEIKIFDATKNVVEAFKAYSQLSLVYSSQEAFRESACMGGMISNEQWPWICAGAPNIPNVENIKRCAGKFSKYFLNIYLDKFSVELPLEIYKEGVEECSVEVDEYGVLSGKYDEGNFWIKCKNAKISLKGKDISVSDQFNVSYYVVNNRFWYLYRKIREWAQENVYGNCICSAAAGCGGCDAVKACAQQALEALKKKFEDDENVECKWEKESNCCSVKRGEMCKEPSLCFSWSENCGVPTCSPECAQETTAFLGSCIPQNLMIFKPKKSWNPNDYTNYEEYRMIYFSSEDLCKVWYEHMLEGRDVFKCTDHKYYIPSKSGPVPLTFTILVQAGFRVPHPYCEFMVPCDQPNCECPQGYTTCTYKVCEDGQCVEKTTKICGGSCPQDQCSSDSDCGGGEEETCSDSDGEDIFLTGACIDKHGSHTDYCISTTTVKEYFCGEGGLCRSEIFECPSRYKCEEGKCVLRNI